MSSLQFNSNPLKIKPESRDTEKYYIVKRSWTSAVNRAYNNSDYIPCILWGRNAKFCQNLAIGTNVKLEGRIQAREYEKKYEDGTAEKRVAYEVSVSKFEEYKKED